MTDKTRFNFLIDTDNLADLKTIAALKGVSVSLVINDLVKTYLTENKAAIDQLKQVKIK